MTLTIDYRMDVPDVALTEEGHIELESSSGTKVLISAGTAVDILMLIGNDWFAEKFGGLRDD